MFWRVSDGRRERGAGQQGLSPLHLQIHPGPPPGAVDGLTKQRTVCRSSDHFDQSETWDFRQCARHWVMLLRAEAGQKSIWNDLHLKKLSWKCSVRQSTAYILSSPFLSFNSEKKSLSTSPKTLVTFWEDHLKTFLQLVLALTKH